MSLLNGLSRNTQNVVGLLLLRALQLAADMSEMGRLRDRQLGMM